MVCFPTLFKISTILALPKHLKIRDDLIDFATNQISSSTSIWEAVRVSYFQVKWVSETVCIALSNV